MIHVPELRLGRWQTALTDVDVVDAVITDPPYSERVILGYRSGSDVSLARGSFNIPYAAWTEADARELVSWIVAHTKHWAVVFNDHVGAGWLRAAFDDAGWYAFHPVPWIRTNPPPRFAADGPANSAEHITVARPRRAVVGERSGSRPGDYRCAAENGNAKSSKITGQKPLVLMREIVRDYTLPGDLVVDPFAGNATTLLACALEGRRSIGAEIDRAHHTLASRRLAGLTDQEISRDPRRNNQGSPHGQQRDQRVVRGHRRRPEAR